LTLRVVALTQVVSLSPVLPGRLVSRQVDLCESMVRVCVFLSQHLYLLRFVNPLRQRCEHQSRRRRLCRRLHRQPQHLLAWRVRPHNVKRPHRLPS
jgi:hypothetical protein